MKRKKLVNVLFNPKEIDFIKEASKKDDRSFSNFLRIGSLQRAKSIYETLELPIPNLEDEEETEEIQVEDEEEEQEYNE